MKIVATVTALLIIFAGLAAAAVFSGVYDIAVEDTELRKGLAPRPPELAGQRREPREAFWIVKHGIKATGMPAWGPTHDDEALWSIVPFLQELPQLDARGYRALVAKAPAHEEAQSAGHSHAPGTAPHGD